MNKSSKAIMDQYTKDGKVDWKGIRKDYVVYSTEDGNSLNFISKDRIVTWEEDEGPDEQDRATVRKIIEEQGYGTP